MVMTPGLGLGPRLRLGLRLRLMTDGEYVFMTHALWVPTVYLVCRVDISERFRPFRCVPGLRAMGIDWDSENRIWGLGRRRHSYSGGVA